MKRFILILLLVVCANLFAQEYQLSSETKITQEQINKIASMLPTHPEDKVYYHWTNLGNGIRWIDQGKLDPGEVGFLNTPTGDRQVYGAGVYLADNPTSSRMFGVVPTAFNIKKGTPLYDEAVIKSVLGKSLTNAEASVLGEKIPYLRLADKSSGWYVFNSPQNAQNIKFGGIYSSEARITSDLDNPFTLADVLKDHARTGDSGYLKNLLNSLEYMDGIAVAPALKTSPQAPWNVFSEKDFGNFQNTLSNEFAKKLYESSGRSRLAKSEIILKDVIPSIYGSLSGEGVKSLSDIVRSEGIRAGGDEAGGTFFATEKQVAEMKKNPYLEVVATKQANGEYLVHYFYPDAFHYKNLKGKISDSLYAQLLKMNPDDLMRDTALRQKLNKQIIEELLKDLFKKAEGISTSITEAKFLELNRDFISIHPFNDFNGRTVRMFSRIVSGERGHYFFSDMDLLIPIEEQREYILRGETAAQNLRKGLVEEFLSAKSENRMPDYLKCGALQKYMEEAAPPFHHFDIADPKVVENIQKRRWTLVFSEAENTGVQKFVTDLKKAPELTLAAKTQDLISITKNPLESKSLQIIDAVASTEIDATKANAQVLSLKNDVYGSFLSNLMSNPTEFEKLSLQKQKAVLDVLSHGNMRSISKAHKAYQVPASFDVYKKLFSKADPAIQKQVESPDSFYKEGQKHINNYRENILVEIKKAKHDSSVFPLVDEFLTTNPKDIERLKFYNNISFLGPSYFTNAADKAKAKNYLEDVLKNYRSGYYDFAIMPAAEQKEFLETFSKIGEQVFENGNTAEWKPLFEDYKVLYSKADPSIQKLLESPTELAKRLKLKIPPSKMKGCLDDLLKTILQ